MISGEGEGEGDRVRWRVRVEARVLEDRLRNWSSSKLNARMGGGAK